MLKFLSKIAASPIVALLSGLILIYTSGSEIFDSMDDAAKIGAHHGVFFLGILQLFKSLPEIVEGTRKLSEAKESGSGE